MQKLINIALAVAVAALAVDRRDGANPAALRDMVAGAVAEIPADRIVGLEARVESHLLANPGILQDVSVALEAERAREQAQTRRAALTALHDQIYDDPANIVLGNPDGDVTLVEFFDYNCTYCRRVVPDMLDLIADDPDLRVVLKEFPILSADSVAAARVGLQVAATDADYALFHTALMTGRGTVTAQAALEAAASLGLAPGPLAEAMDDPAIGQAIERTYAVARELEITGTPAFIIGDEVIPGAVEREELATRIANMRTCGATFCPPPGNRS